MDCSRLMKQGIYKKTLREIAILLKLKHPHLVRVYEAFQIDKQIHVVMEYVPGGELFDLITSRGRISEPESQFIFQQLLSALEFCHVNQIVHRDLKPENILLDELHNIKLADFGLSNIMHDGKFLLTPCGSPNYAAPEIISGRPYCGSQVDIWSTGIILYALLTGSLPFDDNNQTILYRKIREAKYFMPTYLSAQAQDLIKRMLQTNPMDRITIPEIKKHLWYTTNLPFYLCTMDNTKTQVADIIIDPEIIQKLKQVFYEAKLY